MDLIVVEANKSKVIVENRGGHGCGPRTRKQMMGKGLHKNHYPVIWQQSVGGSHAHNPRNPERLRFDIELVAPASLRIVGSISFGEADPLGSKNNSGGRH